jgi:tetratricopeptide (TPR) repeat protein
LAKKELNRLNQQLPKLTPRQQKWFISYLNYVWGHYFFLTGDNDKAIGFINQCIELYDAELDAILANAYLLKGQIHDLNRQRRQAIAAYKIVYNWTITPMRLFWQNSIWMILTKDSLL